MGAQVCLAGDAMQCMIGGDPVYLDPHRARSGALNFVSHAHSDHLPSRSGGEFLASRATQRIAKLRGFEMDRLLEPEKNMILVDSGHIFGSTGLLADGIFYTGDICTRDRGFLRGARVPKCETLITECTFGLPEFLFPPISDIQKQVNAIISENYSRGIPVILMGYQLGKAQTISQLFGHWDPLYYHDSVRAMNDLHRDMGVDIRDAPGHTEARKLGLLDKKPWVMVSPLLSKTSKFVSEMKSMYGAVTVGFSGWSSSTRYAFGRRCDYSVPFSDHCDFAELVRMVRDSGAKKVYTVHGFVEEFAGHLRDIGIDAEPLSSGH